MSQQLLRRAWNFIDTIKQVYPEHWSPEEQVLLDDLMKADLDLSGVKREWVGLTLDEIDLLEELYAPPVHPDFANDASHCLELIRHVEAKLKEKNA